MNTYEEAIAAMMSQPALEARDAICDRARELCPMATVDQLGKLADAVSKVIHGPQGGQLHKGETTSTVYNYTGDTTQRHDDKKPSTTGFQ